MKTTGYPILDQVIRKIEKDQKYSIIFSEEEIEEMIREQKAIDGDKGEYDYVRGFSEELMSFQITSEEEFPPNMNLVKSCSYNGQLEVDFNEKAMKLLLNTL